jgi:hypothetical protein
MWQNTIALALAHGTVRITDDQYGDAHVMLDWTSKYGTLPSPSTMRRTIIPAIRDYSYARPVVCSLRTKNNDPTADSSLQAKMERVRDVYGYYFPANGRFSTAAQVLSLRAFAGERTGIRNLPGFKLLFSYIKKTPIVRNRRQFLDTSSKSFVHPPCKNVAHQEERLPIPVSSGDTISITLLHSEDVRAIMNCKQPFCLISDAIELPELIATIRGVWL